MNAQLRWGIIGCGNVTEVKSGPAFNKVPNSQLLMVMRRDAAKAADYARRHAVPHWTTDASALIRHPEVNAVYIATPPDSHETYAVEALRAGKPVYLEKPMARNAAEAKRIVAAVAETGGKLTVAHYRRQQPLFKTVKRLLHEGIIGRVQTVNLQLLQPHKVSEAALPWRLDPVVSGGGLFHDLAPHQLDLLLYFFGTPRQVQGWALNTGRHYAVPDTVAGQVLFDGDILFNGHWCFAAQTNVDRCEITGTKGRLVFSIFDQTPLIVTTTTGEQQQAFASLVHVQQPMIEEVVNYLLGRAENPCAAEEGVTVMQMMDALTGAGPG